MTEFDERLLALRRRFIEQAAIDAVEIHDRASEMAWSVVRDRSHSIAGRAGMFGFPALSDAASILEEAIDDGADVNRLRPLANAVVSLLRGLVDDG